MIFKEEAAANNAKMQTVLKLRYGGMRTAHGLFMVRQWSDKRRVLYCSGSIMIQEGDMVAIRMHDDKSSSLIRVKGDQKIGKTWFKMQQLVGHAYESVFELRDKKIILVEDDPAFLEKAFDEVQTESSAGGDNSNYVDTNTAQKLNDEDIKSMRAEGVTGINIMKSLIENSSTWNAKTEFAQQKWLSRKSKKYIRRFRVCKSTPMLLCEVIFNRNNSNISNLRTDSLAQIISHGGIHAGIRVLVCDTTLGIVTGSIAYRLNGHGRIISLFTGQQPHLEYCEQMNLDESDLNIIRSAPLNELANAADDIKLNGFQSAENSGSMDLPPPKSDARARARPHQSSCRKEFELLRVRQLLREGMDSLVIVSYFEPIVILREAIYLLAPSSPFVIHCEFMEPLVECYLYLQQKNIAVRMVLSDTWLREYQTLQGRFHPEMNMSTSGGYILSGIYIGNVIIRATGEGRVDAETPTEKSSSDHDRLIEDCHEPPIKKPR